MTPPAPPALTAQQMIAARVVKSMSGGTATKLLLAPCVFCGYSGAGYYQIHTHGLLCPWHDVGGAAERLFLLDKHLLAALTVPPPDVTAWLIERDYAGTPLYWTGRAIHREPSDPDRLGEWSPDVSRALRFARRTDAACMLTWHCQDQGRVVEHMWTGGTGRSEMLAERQPVVSCAGCGWVGKSTVCSRCGRERESGILPFGTATPAPTSAAEYRCDDAETDTCENCQQPITGQVVWSWDDVPLCEECAEPGTFPLPARPTEPTP